MVPKNRDIFPALELPTWFPGETFYSLCARYHAYSANALPRHTSMQLFGAGCSSISHDIPSRLAAFAQRTKGQFGSPESIAIERTVLRFYFAFRPPEERPALLQKVSGESLSGLKFQLGAITSRFRANHPLKACPICLADDKQTLGFSYWRLEHQYPGMCVCSQHGVLLLDLPYKANGVERFSWQLPDEERLLEISYMVNAKPVDARCIERLKSFGKVLSFSVEDGILEPLDPRTVLQTYRQGLFDRGLISKTGRFRWGELAPSYLNYVADLREIPIFFHLPATEEQANSQLGRILRSRGCSAHPLRRITLVEWIFGSWDRFREAYGQVAEEGSPRKTVQHRCRDDGIKDAIMLHLVELVCGGGISVSKAAGILGVDVSTAMHWLALHGHIVARRPKKLKEPMRSAAIADLRAGTAKGVVADRYKISIPTVTTILRTEVNLSREWHEAIALRTLEDRRNKWSQLRRERPGLYTTELRKIDPATYAWLYRNDVDWLTCHLPKQEKRSPKKTVDWKKRDEDLACQVQAVGQALAIGKCGKRIFLWEIYQRIPELRAKLDVLGKLPKTKTLIESIVHT